MLLRKLGMANRCRTIEQAREALGHPQSIFPFPSATTRPTPTTRPLVSVVTPFYNTEPYLAQCIESVLAQSYRDFEYILMDNASNDASYEIAAAYAARDPRIRLIRCSEFLLQLANYNRALSEISTDSKYCKIVQADDWIFPECLSLMVQTFEQYRSVGLVSSYWLEDDQPRPSRVPRSAPMLPGKECVAWYLRSGVSIFGTQTQVMYRSSLVRERTPFYNVCFPFADLQKHLDILLEWDFGFVHQMLSFSRRESGSLLDKLEEVEPYFLLLYIIAQRYAPAVVAGDEAATIVAHYRGAYYRNLAKAALRLRGKSFWRYHKSGLKVLSERQTHDWPYLMHQIVVVLLWMMSNPGLLLRRLLRHRARRGLGTDVDS